MLIGIISDTHENMPKIRQAVAIFNREGVSLVIHAGDIISPITVTEWKKLKSPFQAVFGNNDGEKKFWQEKIAGWGEIALPPRELEIAGKRILLLHAPDNLDNFTATKKYSVIIYGHTHQVDIRRQGTTLIVNPGEAGGWLTNRFTLALLDTKTFGVNLVDF